mmetsp:Transcript_3323/g.4886  ORF Transcript_3323/g.4886 Transcript_3323/m.4886 type:complete len:364 (+) Transcript_3323:414-1505(+)
MAVVSKQSFLKAEQQLKKVIGTLPIPLFHSASVSTELYHVSIKPELLQPIRSFKMRGAANALFSTTCTSPIVTASAGNMGQALAFLCAHHKPKPIDFYCLVPPNTSSSKTSKIKALGGVIISLSQEEWWQVIVSSQPNKYLPTCVDSNFTFVHPVMSENVMIGNGSIALEVERQLRLTTHHVVVLCPFGGGGLSCGISRAFQACSNYPTYRHVIGVEIEGRAPLAEAFRYGVPTPIEDDQYLEKSWIDGIGSKCVLDGMWPEIKKNISGSIVVPPSSVAHSLKALMTTHCLVAEGAGAAAYCAATWLAKQPSLFNASQKIHIVAVISGGSIALDLLQSIIGEKNQLEFEKIQFIKNKSKTTTN